MKSFFEASLMERDSAIAIKYSRELIFMTWSPDVGSGVSGKAAQADYTLNHDICVKNIIHVFFARGTDGLY